MKNGPNTFADGLTRRDFLAQTAQGLALGGLVVAASTLTGVAPWSRARSVPTTIRGAGLKVGHLLRGLPSFGPPKSSERRRIVIVGGGVAGLSAAWWLTRLGF